MAAALRCCHLAKVGESFDFPTVWTSRRYRSDYPSVRCSSAELASVSSELTQYSTIRQCNRKGTPMLAKRRKQPYLAITTIGIAVA